MRDPARIPDMIELINSIWQENPDLRLGQLIYIAHARSNSRADVFNIEDSSLKQGLLEIKNI